MRTRREWLMGSAALLLARDLLAQGQVQQGARRSRGAVQVEPGGITTGSDGEVVFVRGTDALLVRRNSSLEFLANGFRLLTGAVLGTFAPGRPRELRTPTASIGIRGTGVYLEIEPGRTYVCTCYGEAVLEPLANPSAREIVRTRNHDQPRYVMAGGAPQMITGAPVINHTDAELALLEGVAARPAPFPFPGYTPR